MQDKDKPKEQLISELKEMRQRLAELEGSQTVSNQRESQFSEIISRASEGVWEGRPAALGLITDITERKLAEKTLRERERHFQRQAWERTLRGENVVLETQRRTDSYS